MQYRPAAGRRIIGPLDWNTSHQIPRHGNIFQVLQMLESPDFVLDLILACAFVWLVRAKTTVPRPIAAF